jgi:putative peptide modification target (TIGR04139 family)
MKKLNGMKRDFSYFENKKLTDLSVIKGGKLPGGGNSEILSNVNVGEGCIEYDSYSGPNGTGIYLGRDIYCIQQ